MSKKDMQYTECECHNPDHLDTGRNMWEGEIEDEALFEKTDTMTVTIMNEGKVAMCTCGWCGYVNTVDLVNEQITIDCDGKQTVLGGVNKAKGGSITTTLSRMFINFINTGILKTKYEVGGLNVTFCSGISGMGDRNAYAFFYTEHSFGEWKETTLPDGRIVSTRNNGLFYEFKREGHSYTNIDLYTDTGVILMDIKIDDNKLYVCFDMAKMISDYLGLSIGYEPEEVIEENDRYNFRGFSIRYGALSKDNTRRTFMYGCDGTDHALSVTDEFLNEDGTTDYAEHIGDKIICKCNGSCKDKPSVGGFLSSEFFNK
ncbi:MAG: hypothetical protein DRI24_08355 [Deltaproteobacteria bacterium]|nr:MAG: hypothetical protein DRI24_08355 [Deltaproteobacteria bacterium]